MFYRMPPTALELRGRYLAPSYGILLLCSRIVVDTESYDRLTSAGDSAYRHVADVIQALYDEGFIVLEDYSQRLTAARHAIKARVAAVLNSMSWTGPLAESLQLWSNFVAVAGQALKSERDNYIHEAATHSADSLEDRAYSHALGTELVHEEFKLDLFQTDVANVPIRRVHGMYSEVKDILVSYLTYVEMNIELSRQLRAPIYDWADYGPFYRRRLANSDLQTPFDAQTTAVTQLFNVTFPEFRPRSPAGLIKILRDRRIESLRQLVADSVAGSAAFDREFAVRTLFDVVRTEKRIARFRNITSYALLPAGYIPVVGTPLAKAAEEATDALFERNVRAPLDWFYLLSEAQTESDLQTE